MNRTQVLIISMLDELQCTCMPYRMFSMQYCEHLVT